VFHERLAILMSLFKINSSKLARGINVDASLVSRWKSGERRMGANSPHIPALATFFLSLDAYPYQTEYLEQLIAAARPAGTNDPAAARVHALATWLITPGPALLAPLPPEPAHPASASGMLGSIADWFTRSLPDLPDLPAERVMSGRAWHMTATSGQTVSAEYFTGLDGKRQAVLNLLHLALQSPDPCDLMVTSDEGMDWLNEDPVYTRLWAGLLQRAISQGHRLSIIHHVNRTPDEIIGAIHYWLPLHLSGRTRSWYFPHYTDPVIKQSVMIVRSVACCIAQSSGTISAQEITLLLTDPPVLAHYASLFEQIRSRCLPLFESYSLANQSSCLTDLGRLLNKAGRCYHLRSQFNSALIPEHAAILSHGVPGLADWAREIRQLYATATAAGRQTGDIVPLALLDRIERENAQLSLDSDLFISGRYALSRSDTVAWLRQIVTELRTNPDYSLILYPDSNDLDPMSINLTWHEHQAAFFAPVKPTESGPQIILLTEANTLHALGRYIQQLIAQIPSSLRRREDVIARLLKLIDVLSGKTGVQADA
jgi:hypothetical protein